MRIVSLCLFAFVILSPVVFGQADPPRKKTIELRVACFQALENFSKIVLPGHDGDIQLSDRYPSAAVKATLIEGEMLNLYASGNPITEASPVIGKVAIPFEADRGMILLFPHKKQYGGVFIEGQHFPTGSIYMRNFSPHKIQVEVDNRRIRIMPNGVYVYKPSYSGSKSLKVQIKQLIDGGKWKLISSSSWRFVPSRKEMVLFFLRAGSETVRIKGITQLGESPMPK